MKSIKLSCKILLLNVILLTLFMPNVGAQATKPQQAAGGSVVLAYNPPVNKELTYQLSTSVTQMMDVEGQSMTILINNNLGYRTKMTEKKNNNLNLVVTVESLNMNIDAMGSSTGREITEVKGKSFNMLVSGTGKVVDASEASRLEYSVEGQGNVNLGETFRSIFPLMPGKSMKPGETWTMPDTLRNQTAEAKVLQITEVSGKYEGNETVNGIVCAKIVSTIKGTMETTTQNQGMDIFLHGPVKGQSVVYFALKDGYVIKEEATSRMNGIVEISGPMSMSFPVVMDISSKLELK